MKRVRRIMMGAFSVVLVLSVTGCALGGGFNPGGINIERPIPGGYLPTEITDIEKGGDFDAASLTPHDSEKMPLSRLEGCWVYEGVVGDNESGGSFDDNSSGGSSLVTDKTIILNEKKIECLPKSIDIRPYSPEKALISKGFGYGAAVFQDASGPDGTGIYEIQTSSSLPYAGNGFICATDGSTLALGFLSAEAEMDEYGVITDEDDKPLSECTLTEVDYEVSLDGDRLKLSYDGVDATYIQEPAPLYQLHDSKWMFEPLYEGSTSLGLLGNEAKNLLNKGFELDCDLDEFLPSCTVSEEFTIKTPGGATLLAKLVNPYEKKVPFGFSKVCWYEYDGQEDEKLTLGIPSTYEWSHSSQEFGVTPFSDVYNYYELPYEHSQDYLCYKSGYLSPISQITAWGEGYDKGDTVLESEHSCDIRLEFKNNVLSSVSVGDTVYLTAGLQDNIAHDDLDDLEPSVYREATKRRDTIIDELKKSFKRAGIDAAIDEKTGEVVMDNSILFEVNSYELGDEGKEYLDKVFSAYASVILDDKYSTSLKDVSFEGNTDSDGGSEYNMRLSENRANAVMEYCSSLLDDKQRTVFDELATSKGYGESNPIYDENGKEDKDASRRVAVKFIMKVDGLAEDTETPSDSGDSSDSSVSESDSASDNASESDSASDNSSEASDEKEESNELEKFRSISSNFNHAWLLYEEPDKDDTEHLVVLLLSEDHRYCAYFDLTQDSTNATGNYTFGEASVEKAGEDNETITVKHGGDNDKFMIVFNAWGSEDVVSVIDPWKGIYNLNAHDDVDAAISVFEDAIS